MPTGSALLKLFSKKCECACVCMMSVCCMCVCLYCVCMFACLSIPTLAKTLNTKSTLFARNGSYRKPVLNLQPVKLWFKMGNRCQFKIQVDRISNGLYGCKNNEGDRLGYQV